MKLITAGVSLTTVVALIRVAPQVVELPSLVALNTQLKTEIEHRLAAEKELHLQREETQLILDSIPSLVILKDTNNGIRRVNRAVEKKTGRDRSEIEGRASEDVFPEMAEKYYAHDLDVIRSKRPKLNFIESVEDRWIQTDKVPVFDDDGSVTGIIMVATDITEMRRAEDMVRVAFEATPTGLMTVDQNQVVAMANAERRKCVWI